MSRSTRKYELLSRHYFRSPHHDEVVCPFLQLLVPYCIRCRTRKTNTPFASLDRAFLLPVCLLDTISGLPRAPRDYGDLNSLVPSSRPPSIDRPNASFILVRQGDAEASS